MTRVQAIGVAMLGLTLTGCGGWRESVGLEVPPPDEFLVVSRAPLQMPPSLTALPVPQPDAPSLVDRDPQAAARTALAGAGTAQATGQSAGEQALVSRAGPADPAIRDTLANDTVAAGQRRFGLDSFFGIPIVQNPELAGRQLDSAAEAERLRNAGVAAPVIVEPGT